MARRLLWASLGLAPITMIVRFATDADDVTLFVLAAVSLVPLAWLIGEATEHAAEHTGPGIGGFLNATFGNAPELIIALFAINDGLFEVVRGSLTGSVVGNLLLVLGFSLLVGPTKEIDRRSTLISIGARPRSPRCSSSSSRSRTGHGDVEPHTLEVLSIPVSIVLLLVYVGVTWLAAASATARSTPEDDADEAALVDAGHARRPRRRDRRRPRSSPRSSSARSRSSPRRLHLSDFFVAAVIVAIVGNAAEHGGAIVVARRGHIKLATEIALSSSAQVAVFLIPAVVAALVGDQPARRSRSVRSRSRVMARLGAPGRRAARAGRSSSWRGVVLVAAYVGRRRCLLQGRRPLGERRRRRARDRVGRPVELLDRAVGVADDAQELAALAALGDAEAIVAVGLEDETCRGLVALRRPGAQRPVLPPEDERPSPPSHQRAEQLGDLRPAAPARAATAPASPR